MPLVIIQSADQMTGHPDAYQATCQRRLFYKHGLFEKVTHAPLWQAAHRSPQFFAICKRNACISQALSSVYEHAQALV
jgi:hypothetical protein